MLDIAHPLLLARSAPIVPAAIVGAVVLAGVTLAASDSLVIAALAAAFVGAVGAAAVDARTWSVPDELVVLVAAPPVLAAVLTGRLGAVLLGALILGSPLLVVHVAGPGSLGFGDVKLGAALGLAVGLVEPHLGVVALCLASLVTVVAAAIRTRSALPFGPGLVLGAAVSVLAAGPLASLLTGGAPTWR